MPLKSFIILKKKKKKKKVLFALTVIHTYIKYDDQRFKLLFQFFFFLLKNLTLTGLNIFLKE